MGSDGSATGGSRPQPNARYLTVTPSAAGKLPPPLRSVSSRLLDFYHECVDNGGWAIRVMAWRSLPSSAESRLRLLPALPPLLRHVSLDARLAPGGRNAIKGGGKFGPRGGFPAPSSAYTHPQPTTSPPRLSRLPPVKPPQQQIPRRRQQFHPRRRSRLRHLRRSASRHCRHRHRRRHHRSRHPPHVNVQKQ